MPPLVLIAPRDMNVGFGPTPAAHRGKNRTGEDIVPQGCAGKPLTFSFTENGADPGGRGTVCTGTRELALSVRSCKRQWRRRRGLLPLP
jgi:hypothetical protein